MTLTIELPPAREARLREKAAQQGKDVAAYLLDLADPEGAEKRKHDPATIAAIAEGIADGEAGREISLEDYVAHTRAERDARRAS